MRAASQEEARLPAEHAAELLERAERSVIRGDSAIASALALVGIGRLLLTLDARLDEIVRAVGDVEATLSAIDKGIDRLADVTEGT